MKQPEDPLAQAERHFRQAQEHIIRQMEIIAKLEQDGHERMADKARGLLTTLRQTLELARDHLKRIRKEQD